MRLERLTRLVTLKYYQQSTEVVVLKIYQSNTIHFHRKASFWNPSVPDESLKFINSKRIMGVYQFQVRFYNRHAKILDITEELAESLNRYWIFFVSYITWNYAYVIVSLS